MQQMLTVGKSGIELGNPQKRAAEKAGFSCLGEGGRYNIDLLAVLNFAEELQLKNGDS